METTFFRDMEVNHEIEISTAARLRAGAAGVIVGIAAGSSYSSWKSLPDAVLPQTQVATILLAAGVAGFLAAMVLPRDLVCTKSAYGIAARKGLRAGLFAALAAACLLSLSARADALNAPTSFAEAAIKHRMWMMLLVSLTAIMPALFCGFVGSALGCRAVAIWLPARPESEDAGALPEWTRFLSHGVVVLACLGLLSPLTFIGRPPKVDPPPPVVVAPPLPPAPPPFHFTPSPGFATAKLGQINVNFIKTIEGVDSQAPMAMMPDYTRFAFCDRSHPYPAITVFDLDWFKPVASIVIPNYPRRNLAWSPDFAHIACVIDGGSEGSRVWILDIAELRATELPLPKNGDVPNGDCFWWGKDELAFFPSDEAPLVLNLETLTLKPADRSAILTKADEATKNKWLKGPRPGIPTFKRWDVTPTDVVMQLTPPGRRTPDAPWSGKTSTLWAFSDPKLATAHVLQSLPIAAGMKCYCPPDASKLILVHDQKAEVAFMRLTPPPVWTYEVEMPGPPDSITDESARSQISKKQLCAFAYAPLNNPLNNTTVGPDHNRVKATLRLEEWKGSKATFAITQFSAPLNSRDIVASLHTWEAGHLVAWKAAHRPDWWTFSGSAVEKETKDSPADTLETPSVLDVDSRDGAFVVVSRPRTFTQPVKAPDKVVEKPVVPNPSPVNDQQMAVKAFIEEHHRKASQGDIWGMVADYADVVDFLDKGLILRDKIATEEKSHRELWPLGREAIKSEIHLQQDGDAWQATYAMSFRNENAKGDWQSGMVDLDMRIKPFKNGFLIVSHKAKVHDLQHSEAAVKTTLDVPRPRYVMMVATPAIPDLRIRDAISFQGGMTWQRIFMKVTTEGKILQTCRLTFTGSGGVAADGRTARIFVGGWHWDQSFPNNSDLTKVALPIAAAMLGKNLSFRFVQGGMIDNESEYKLELEK